MKKGIKFAVALVASKCARIALKMLRKNATHFPGAVALKICPDFISKVNKPEKIIGVIGTNGKTTVANLISDILEFSGKKVLSNRSGGNIREGICTALICGVNLFGKSKYDIAVLEMDERSSRFTLPFVKPDYLVCTNLFRDSFKRNAHSEFISGIISDSIPEGTTLICNADDMISSRLSPENPRKFFSVAPCENERQIRDNIVCDMVVCPKCNSRLVYDFQRYNHIGKLHCDNCDFASPNADYVALDATADTTHLKIAFADREVKIKRLGKNIIDVYNSLTAFTALCEFGIDADTLVEAFEKMEIVKTRYNETTVKDKKIVLNLAKGQNPIACSRTFDFIRQNTEDMSVVLLIDDFFDAAHSSENIAWIYDADFEFLNAENIKQIVIGGARCEDYRVRLLLAGVDNEKICTIKDENQAAEYIDYSSVEKVFILYDVYTIHLANSTKKRLVQRIEEGNIND